MDEKTGKKLDETIEEAIAQVVVKLSLKKLPLLPGCQTINSMAKAAVAVCTEAVES